MVNLLRGWLTYQQGIQWEIGNGKDIIFWEDVWLNPNETLKQKFIGSLPRNCLTQRVADYILSHRWNLDQVIHSLDDTTIHNIKSTYIPIYTQAKDTGTWGLTSSWIFTT